jgi:hypothetical protein
VDPPLRETPYLKLFRQNNSMHTGQRDHAIQLATNLTPFDLRTYLSSCHFNHNLKDTKEVDYRVEDMVHMGQREEVETRTKVKMP